MELNLSTRETLIASLPKHGVVAEIGVEYGVFSMRILDLNEPKLLVLVDCWEYQDESVTGSDPANNPAGNKVAQFLEVINKFSSDERVAVCKMFSEKAAATFPDEHFDWIYIDANHLRVVQDIEAWFSKVKYGGWITGHDYTNVGDYITVKKDIDNYVKEKNIELFVTTGEGGNEYEKFYPTWAFKKNQ